MPLPAPERNESEGSFYNRCMSDPVMTRDYEDEKQRYAVCVAQWEKK